MTFPTDYFAAREQFRSGAKEAGLSHQAIPIDAVGPQNEQLTIDVAFRPAQPGEPLLIVSGGLHGVEGLLGSAVQLAALERWQAGLPAGVGILLLHALNPYGYAHLRRFNEDNVDPNRNFLPTNDNYHGTAEEYHLLDRLLNPPCEPSRWDLFTLRATWARFRYGSSSLKQAVVAGQYDYPRGLFFGGDRPSQLVAILQENLPRWLEHSTKIVHLDYHTGLGCWGKYDLLIEYAISDSHATWLQRHFGSHVCRVDETQYQTRGGLGTWFRQQANPRDYTYFCAEFGTYPGLAVVRGLRAENQAHHWGEPSSQETKQVKQQLSELFCPAADSWRASALQQGVELIDQALHALR